MWKRSEEFRAQARHCEEIARLMSTPEGKREFAKLAHGWIKLAEHADKEEQMRDATKRGIRSNLTQQNGSKRN